MCFAAPVMAGIAGFGQLAGAGISAAAQARQARISLLNARTQKQLLDQQAAEERTAALAEEEILREQASAAIADQAVSLAAQGSDITTGSPLLIQAKSAENLRRDQLIVRHGGSVRARRAEQEGILALRRGENAAAASRFGIATTLLNAFNRSNLDNFAEAFG